MGVILSKSVRHAFGTDIQYRPRPAKHETPKYPVDMTKTHRHWFGKHCEMQFTIL